MISDMTPSARETSPTWRQTWWRRVRYSWPHLARFFNYLLIVAAVGFTIWQLKQGGDALGGINYSLKPGYLALILLLHAGGLFLGSLGWAYIVRALNPNADLFRSMQVYYITNIPKNIPGNAWHVLSRIYLHQKGGEAKTVTAVAMVLELMLTAWAGASIYLIGLLVSPAKFVLAPIYPLILLLVGSLTLCPPIFNRLASAVVRRLTRSNAARVDLNLGRLSWLLSLYCFLIALGGLLLFLAISIVYALDWALLPAVMGAWGISLMISTFTFWIPINLRIRDGILLLALTALMPPAAALVVVVIWRFSIMLSEFSWALTVSAASLLFFDQEQVLWSGLLERWPWLSRLRRRLRGKGDR